MASPFFFSVMSDAPAAEEGECPCLISLVKSHVAKNRGLEATQPQGVGLRGCFLKALVNLPEIAFANVSLRDAGLVLEARGGVGSHFHGYRIGFAGLLVFAHKRECVGVIRDPRC